MVQSVLGMASPQPSSDGETYTKLLPPETTEQLIDNLFGDSIGYSDELRTSTPIYGQAHESLDATQSPDDVSLERIHSR